MKIILLQNIKGLGRIGDIKNVANGYGRNFLIARKLAKPATESAVKESEALIKRAEMAEKIRQGKAKEITESMKDMVIEISRKASDKGTLFDGIEAKDIAEALTKKVLFDITEDMINLPEPIKHIGKHTIELQLSQENKALVTINVISE